MELKLLDARLQRPEFAPAYATPGAAAFDLRACIDEPIQLEGLEERKIKTGLALFMGSEHGALILPRSGLGTNHGLVIANLVGLIDPDYQGELTVTVWNRRTTRSKYVISPMDRIAQLVIVPVVRPQFKVVSEFSTTTQRGTGGHGSTGLH